ncbi:DinB family protein [mine drainage metagenome]|uniref:DinB family protein n=1 Tax=mine drainage metagenome TaxID=410659 RepID=A0A1J5QWH6_9ZZZZ
MSRISHIGLMASYNEWMNAKVYEAATTVPADDLSANKKAFFGSIIGTLNHVAVGDTLWLKRFASHPANHTSLEPIRGLPAPKNLDQILFTDIQSLSKYRKWLDGIITAWAHSLTESDLDHVLRYTNMKGEAGDKKFFSLVMNFFNHQTHHRGQVTTLLSQADIDVGVTDLLALIPNEASE